MENFRYNFEYISLIRSAINTAVYTLSKALSIPRNDVTVALLLKLYSLSTHHLQNINLIFQIWILNHFKTTVLVYQNNLCLNP